MKKSLTNLLFAALLMGIVSPACPAGAVLGESASTIEADRMAMSAVNHRSSVRSSYSVQEVTSESTAVREYVSPSGIVFGIAWNGLVHPDLDQLLGSYAGTYRRVLSQTPRQRGLRRTRMKADNLVVETWGHMRNLQGRAYDPALMPAGVSADEIR
jgi:hypothetical protein